MILFHFIHFRSGLFTHILLVLIVSITCVQTKEIKNSLVSKISTTNHSSIVVNGLKSVSITDDPIYIKNDTNLHRIANHLAINSNINNAPINNLTTVKKPINSITANKQIPHAEYSIYNIDQIEINNDNELLHAELPTPIQCAFHSNTVHIEQSTTERNGKESNILRSALRVAARQGLDAMVELFDKKEPHLLQKGQSWCFSAICINMYYVATTISNYHMNTVFYLP